jgi:di/tricarboxylate transporter
LETDIIYRRLAQAVISAHSPLLHKTLKEVQFRKTFGAAVIAIHRAGHSINGDLSSTPLHAGDVLVLEAGPDFASNFSQNKAFALINEVPNSSPVKSSKMWIALILTTLMVTTQVCRRRFTLHDLLHCLEAIKGQAWSCSLWHCPFSLLCICSINDMCRLAGKATMPRGSQAVL